MQSDDPLNILGFGIVTYRNLLYMMIWLFIALTAIMTPAISIYSSGSGYDEVKDASWE